MSLPPEFFRVPRVRSKLSPVRIRSGLARRVRQFLFRNDPKIRRSVGGLTRGVRLRMDFRLHSLVLFGLYEVELAPHIRDLCRPGTTSYDIGAHDGYYALILAKRARDRVLAIEPDPEARAALADVLRANPSLAPFVEVVPELVGGSPGEGHTTTLDELAWREKSFVPDLVKVDAEGAEAEILRGAQRLLRERRPHFVIETHSRGLEDECIALLRAAGYDPTIVEQRRWLRESRPLLHNRWIVARGLYSTASA
jgi:hypothetical protein